MRKIVFCVLLLGPGISNAQPSLPENVSDSLWGTWMDESQPDSTRLHAIHEFTSKGYLFSKPDSALYYAQMQHAFAQNAGIKTAQAEALSTHGLF